MEEYCGNSVVSVILSETNYEAWSFQVKHYLLARDLWHVVAKTGTARRPKEDHDRKLRLKAWKRKNSAALHAILISCGSSNAEAIKGIKSARLAWATLAERHKLLAGNEMAEYKMVAENTANAMLTQTQGNLILNPNFNPNPSMNQNPNLIMNMYSNPNPNQNPNPNPILFMNLDPDPNLNLNPNPHPNPNPNLFINPVPNLNPNPHTNPNPNPNIFMNPDPNLNPNTNPNTNLFLNPNLNPNPNPIPIPDPNLNPNPNPNPNMNLNPNPNPISIPDPNLNPNPNPNPNMNSNPNPGPAPVFNFMPYEKFFKDVLHGDWDAVRRFLDECPEAVRVRSPGLGKNALHVAVTEGHLHVVDGLLGRMTVQDVEMQRNDGYTALAAAIEVGNLPIAKSLLRKNKRLISFVQQAYGIPIVHAVVSGQKHMVHYLYSATPDGDLLVPDEGRRGASLLSQCIFVQHLDIALHLLERAPFLAITDDVPGKSPICALAHSKIFPSGSSLTFWQQWIYSCIRIPDSTTNHISLEIQYQQDHIVRDQNDTVLNSSKSFLQCCKVGKVLLCLVKCGWSYLLQLLDIKNIYKTKKFHVQSLAMLKKMCKVIEDTSDDEKIKRAGIQDALISAVYAGNVEFISSMAKANPTLVWNPYIARRVFEVAVEHRQAKIFSLIYGLRDKTAIVSYRDENNSNMLHKAAAVAPSRLLKLIPGAALQMQTELQWFKEVEALASPAAREWTNKEFLKPRALFTENHKALVEEGEKWMKDTASASTIVGALIVTITFAAAFTFPGGNEQTYGFPMFLKEKFFRVFMMSNAVALFTSTTSVLVFLGILTSRYGEEDFLKSLPKKLIIGLSTLFLSIAAMIITFCAGLTLMFHEKSWVVVPSISLACIPVSFFVLMQFKLLVDIFLSTYGPSIFDRNLKRWI